MTHVEQCQPPESEYEVCKAVRFLISEASKKKEVWCWSIRKVLPSEDECSINLSSKNFRRFWSEWWGSEEVPQLDIDILVVLDEEVVVESAYGRRSLGRPTLLGIEVKYFKKGCGMNFYEGLDQALAYLRIGLDKVALLHVFHPDYPEKRAEVHAKTTETLVAGLKLPVAYVACKFLNSTEFRLYTGYSEPCNVTIREVFHFLKHTAPLNPLYSNSLYADDVIKKRQTLIALLQIPAMY